MRSAPIFERRERTKTSTTLDPGSNVVDVFVRSLRSKIGAERILTVRGVGYRLRPTRD